MNTLSEYIKSQPQRSMSEWAREFGITRPYLHMLLSGDRMPSVSTAIRIEHATGGKVGVTAWPNLAAVVDAAKGTAA
jgi:DNA-binding phage protein